MSKWGENIHKRKDGRWEGRVKTHNEITGVTKVKSLYGKSRSEVKDKIKAYLSDPANQSHSKAECTFEELLNLWLNANRIRLKGGTISTYYSVIHTHIIPKLGRIPACSLDVEMINSYLAKELEQGRQYGEGGLSPSYVRTIMLVIKAALHYGVENGFCPPVAGKICKPTIYKKDIRILTVAEQRQLEERLHAASDELRTGIFLSLYAGLRLGEICALSWDDVDLKDRIIHVRHTTARVMGKDNKSAYAIDTPKTGNSHRDIPIVSLLYDVLLQRRRNSTFDYVVSNRNGFLNPRNFEHMYRRIMKELCLCDVNFHALRHTFATRCIEAGVDVKSLSEILGHSNAATTLNTYVHPSMELKRIQIEKLDLL